jgi:hypothetical protein
MLGVSSFKTSVGLTFLLVRTELEASLLSFATNFKISQMLFLEISFATTG